MTQVKQKQSKFHVSSLRVLFDTEGHIYYEELTPRENRCYNKRQEFVRQFTQTHIDILHKEGHLHFKQFNGNRHYFVLDK